MQSYDRRIARIESKIGATGCTCDESVRVVLVMGASYAELEELAKRTTQCRRHGERPTRAIYANEHDAAL